MSAHTPGPWQVRHVEYGDNVSENLGVYQCSPHFHEVAYIAYRYLGERDKATEQANARLIAAAPELLDALENLYEAFLEVPPTTPARLYNQKALAVSRDLIAELRGSDPETVQNAFEDYARIKVATRTAPVQS